eukprot:TRINITY_DN147_c0_g1_i5.p1 TRINITY_DN147_c0_g1~~TRINITY_DN147_c0_g1_i5.p1  ORF type:complete len:484 (+),score=62.98 TRINITY_DN147_c0_g1_i5:3360-4811(+)
MNLLCVIISCTLVASAIALYAPYQYMPYYLYSGASFPVGMDLLPESEVPEFYQGLTPAKVIIEKVVAYPDTGSEDMVVLRNMGGQVADLTSWTMTDSKGDPVYTFGTPGCEGNATIPPQEFLVITPQNEFNPCGFTFGISFRDALILYNFGGEVVANVTWESSEKGSAIRYVDGRYVQVVEIATVVDVLNSVEEFSIFATAIKSVGLDGTLQGAFNPNYDGVEIPSPPSPSFTVEFPWWFGFTQDRSLFSPPPPPPPPPPSPPLGEVPTLGPYTIFAPTNEAFDQLLLLLGGGRVRVPLQAFLNLPELEDILLYHIYYGEYTTDFMFNNTGIKSVLGSEVVVMKDARWTEGQIALNDACVDKPTTGYPCAQQLEFDKCYEPFMISPLASGWQGGFCQKTCQRCNCNDAEGNTCAKIEYPDILAGNGVVHGISRVMFAPPIFDEIAVEEEIEPVPEDELGIVTLPSIPSNVALPVLPGFQGLSK